MCSKTLYEPLLQYNTNYASVLGKHSCTFMREAVGCFTFGGSMQKYNCCFMQAHLCFNFWGSTVCFHAKSITILHAEAHTHVRCAKMMRKNQKWNTKQIRKTKRKTKNRPDENTHYATHGDAGACHMAHRGAPPSYASLTTRMPSFRCKHFARGSPRIVASKKLLIFAHSKEYML